MTTKTFLFSNGDKVREKVTGFTGIITGTCFYLTGCSQHLVTAKSKDNSPESVAIWYDEGRLELIEKEVYSDKTIQSEDKGGDIAPNTGRRGA